MNSIQQNQVGLYVHLPYCISKCPYCDFNSYGIGAMLEDYKEKQYLEAVLQELHKSGEQENWSGRQLRSIFFGGGTPSLFSADSIKKIIDAASGVFTFADEIETTLEVNPGTIQEELGREKLKAFRQAGINRISMGVQSFNSQKLAFLGRLHSAADAKLAVTQITEAGFENFNLDLMFGTKGESLAAWKEELCTAISLGSLHLSAYGLTIETGTEFGVQSRKGVALLAEEDEIAEMYVHTQEFLQQHGFEQYEVSNFAKPGFECAHNVLYWSGKDYLGLGAGAHSYYAGRCSEESWGLRWSNTPKPEHYIERVRASGEARQRIDPVSRKQAKVEFFQTRLRKRAGILKQDYEESFAEPFPAAFQQKAEQLKKQGLLEIDATGYRLSKKGFLFSDSVFLEFLD